jgi:hypothetical protein
LTLGGFWLSGLVVAYCQTANQFSSPCILRPAAYVPQPNVPHGSLSLPCPAVVSMCVRLTHRSALPPASCCSTPGLLCLSAATPPARVQPSAATKGRGERAGSQQWRHARLEVHVQYKACSWRCRDMTAAVVRHYIRQHCPGAVRPYAAASLLSELCCDGTVAVLHSQSDVQLQCCGLTAAVLLSGQCYDRTAADYHTCSGSMALPPPPRLPKSHVRSPTAI